MKLLIFAIYCVIGIIFGRILGYRGLVDTLIWPVTVPLALWLRIMKKNDDERRG